MFQRTTAINKLLSLKKRKRVIQGGTWAGKTYGIIACIIDRATRNPGFTGTVIAETIPAIKSGALKDFKKIMQETGRWVEGRFNASELHYTFANGYKLEFRSFDSVGKAQAAGKREDLFINEAPYINYEIADALIVRSTELIWIDFNPTHEFWAHTEILTNPDAEFLLLKHSDNEALPQTILDELMLKVEKAKTSAYWANWCRVYIDGEIGSLQGVVFTNWDQVPEVPLGAELLGIGMDFGFSNDPTTAVKVFRSDGEIYCDELIYETNLLNSDLIERLTRNGVTPHMELIPDSADPKTIAELRRAGFRVSGAMKGGDSIRAGIALLQDKKVHITERSVNLIKELRNYRWKTDQSGKATNEPIDSYNHAIDAIRYVALNKLGRRSGYSFA